MLLIGTTGTETRFLSEAELPECARLAYGAEGRDDSRPEEFADRELAEALQRSIQDSGKKYSHRFCLQPAFDWTFGLNSGKIHMCMSHLKLRTLNRIHAVIQIISHVIFGANPNCFIAICSKSGSSVLRLCLL